MIDERSQDAALASAIGILATREFDALCVEFPEQYPLGGTLFLGKHYALTPRGVMMLGINPGMVKSEKSSLDFHVKTYADNCLLPGSDDYGIRYWKHARTLFSERDELRAEMDDATFSFCCPFRTASWSNGLHKSRRAALIGHSRPIMAQMLDDCAPRLVIIAGVAGEALFREVVGSSMAVGRPLDGHGDAHGTYQWRAYVATLGTTSMTVAQIPHLSRARSTARLKECGIWLTEILHQSLE